MTIFGSRVSAVLSLLPVIALSAGVFFVFTQWKTALYYTADLRAQVSALVKESPVERSRQVKGIYVNRVNTPAIREEIDALLSNTELNAVVIDIKEADGPYLPDSLRDYIKELHEKGIWVIARICVFRDASLVKQYPEWYLWTKKSDNSLKIWQDSGGAQWLDPKGPGAQNYIIEFSKKAIDLGFDELQFDYIRFPSDGDVANAVYPFYDAKNEEKYEVMGNFFTKISQALREHDEDIILSVDFFGSVATNRDAAEIGQRTSDAAKAFDYISYMLYPSHFYSGLQLAADEERGLPALNLSGETVSTDPYSVISRSIFIASDYLNSIGAKTKIRPWLQDFNINKDADRGIYYDAEKVRAQILAAEESGATGWLLWNPTVKYTASALRP